jgi:hypothetical protein
VRLAADPNVLLSAVVGGRARVLLTHPGVDAVLTTATTLGEVQEYLSTLRGRSGWCSLQSSWQQSITFAPPP